MQFTPNSVLSEVTICNNNINKIMQDLNSFFNQKSMFAFAKESSEPSTAS